MISRATRNSHSTHYGRILLLGVLALVSSGCSRTGLAVINLWAHLGNYTLTGDMPYGEHALQTLDIYRPNNATKPSPVVVFFYGGCWGGCTTYGKSHYRFVADTLTAEGYVVVIADYRLYPEVLIDPILDDGAAATQWVLNNIKHYGGDASKVFLAGHSAGAHIAAMTVLTRHTKNAQETPIAGFIGLAGPYDFLPLTEPYQKELFGPEENYPNTQPINFVSGNEPPMLLLWGQADDTVYRHNLVNMAAKLQSVGGEVETHIYKDMSHVGILTQFARPYRHSSAVLNDINGFIRKNR